MKRVLIAYVQDGHAGGIDRYILNLYDGLKNTDQVDLLTNCFDFDMDQMLSKNGSKLIEVPSLKHPLAQYKRIKKVVQDGAYDTVYFNISTALALPGILAAKRANAGKVIVHSHSADVDISSVLKRRLVKGVHQMFRLVLPFVCTDYYACSKHAGLWMFPKRIVNSKKFRLVSNAIDVGKFSFNKSVRLTKRKELGIESNFVVGHVGSFLYVKNHAFMLEVFKELLRKEPNAKLLFVGNGPLKEGIISKATQYGLQNSVLFLGEQENVQDFYQAMDVFVLPSRFEGLGIVAVEAQCSGLKCVFSNNVPSDVALVNENCTFLGIDNVEPWVDALLKHKEYVRTSHETDIIKSGYSLGHFDFRELV